MKDDVFNEILNDESEPYTEEDKILAPLLEEIDIIEDPGILSFVRAVLVKAPSHFWSHSSSFTGNYHPPDERGFGGAVVHTQRVVRLAREMTVAQDRSSEELDHITAAALIHDVTKGHEQPDGEVMYDPMHPYTVDTFVAFVRSEDNKYSDETRSSTLWVSDEDLSTILRMVRCHMGSWSPIPETMPVTSLELTLHLADLLASKLHIMLDGDNVQDWRWRDESDDE